MDRTVVTLPRSSAADPAVDASAFWQHIEQTCRERLRLANDLRTDPYREARIRRIGAIFGLALETLSQAAQIEAVACAMVPLRFQLT